MVHLLHRLYGVDAPVPTGPTAANLQQCVCCCGTDRRSNIDSSCSAYYAHSANKGTYTRCTVVYWGGGIRGYTPYTNLWVFLTAIINKQGTFRPFANAPLRISTSIFSNTPLTVYLHIYTLYSTVNTHCFADTTSLEFCDILDSTVQRNIRN